MLWLIGTSFSALWISLLVVHLPWTLCGRGGGRIRIGASWFQFSRREVEHIFAALNRDELAAVRAGGVAAQDALAAAAARFLLARSRHTDEQA